MTRKERIGKDRRYDKIMSPAKPALNINKANKELCRCLICGQVLDMLTHVHASKHNYKDKYEMVADGKVKFLYKGVAE